MSGLSILLVIVLIVLGVLAWDTYQSNGKVVAYTLLGVDDAIDEAITFFVPGGWKVEQEAEGFVFMRSGASGCTSLLLLVIFFPLGLVYLFTDWGRGSVKATAWQNNEESTGVELDWNNAGIRGAVKRLAEWYECQDEPDDRPPVRKRRRYQRRSL